MSSGPRVRLGQWIAALVALASALLVASVFMVLIVGGIAAEPLRAPTMIYTFLACVALILTGILVARHLSLRLPRAALNLEREVRRILQTKQTDRPIRIPEPHGLGDLPTVIDQLVDELRGSRRGVVRAMATATARVEQEKGWLEVILLELVRQGVVVCNLEHRVLLYNRPAARLFRQSHALGLGRSLLDVIGKAPVLHALEQLEHRLQGGHHDLGAPFVCSAKDSKRMLEARMALTTDPSNRPTGYVLTLEDISEDINALARQETVRRAVTRDLRAPLASLRAAAENLAAYPDLDASQRAAFLDVIVNESKGLSVHLEQLAEEYRGTVIGHRPMLEIYSPELLGSVARHLGGERGISIAVTGEAHWLMADGHTLLAALKHVVDRLQQTTGCNAFEISAALGSDEIYLGLKWQGDTISSAMLREWLEEPLPALADTTAGEVLEYHGSEPWCQRGDDGKAILRIPLQPPPRVAEAEDSERLPARPEYYDFDLMYAHGITGDLGERKLRDLSYVVFDTETTGLRPTGGDEIISIAGIRVTKGRVLEAESFSALIHPGRDIPKDSTRFHGITDEMVRDQPRIEEVLPRFYEFASEAVLVAHNAAFDMKFLKLKESKCGLRFDNPVIDTLLLSVLIEGDDEDHSLDGISDRLGIDVLGRHTALGDALATAHILVHLLDRLDAMGLETFGEVMKASNMDGQLKHRGALFAQSAAH